MFSGEERQRRGGGFLAGNSALGVALVEYQQMRHVARADLSQRAEADVDMVGYARVGGVDHDQQQVGLDRDAEGGAKGGDQSVRQIADEADGVGQQDFAAGREPDFARLGVECSEEAVVHVGTRTGERVEER